MLKSIVFLEKAFSKDFMLHVKRDNLSVSVENN